MQQLFTICSAGSSDEAAIVALLGNVDLLTHAILAPGTQYWVAEDQHGQLVGVAGVEWGQTAALLRSVAVLPCVRKQGLGNLLVHHALYAVRAAGYTQVYFSARDPVRIGSAWASNVFPSKKLRTRCRQRRKSSVLLPSAS